MMTKANTKYKTVKRDANVGERILITGAVVSEKVYANGDVNTVTYVYDGDVYVKEHTRPVLSFEYEVIIDSNPSDSERITALETQVAEVQAELQALKKRKKPTPNEQRKAVIERAKAFVGASKRKVTGIVANGLPAGGTRLEISDVYSPRHNGRRTACNAEFIVNVDKRTVVVLLKGIVTGKLYAKGIAKCAPDDVFNADIGKAIALGRALGLDVSEFENAPKPTEVVVGMVVDTYIDGDFFKTVKPMKVIEGHRMYSNLITAEYTPYDPGDKITDDTDAQY